MAACLFKATAASAPAFQLRPLLLRRIVGPVVARLVVPRLHHPLQPEEEVVYEGLEDFESDLAVFFVEASYLGPEQGENVTDILPTLYLYNRQFS